MKTKEQVVPKWFKGQIYEEGDNVTNQFSGESYVLNALELSLYDYIMGSQYIFEVAPKTVTQKQLTEFQKALTWFRKNNVEAYFVLLD
jgi:hypothetical protein|tara:strand:+ start:283 stop:546 length:264 start_codon:yes stop_codon:yes gene_type:complete